MKSSNNFMAIAERALVALLGLVASWQLRHTFFFAQIGGAYFEYGSLHIYAGDLVLICLLVLWLFDFKRGSLRLGPKMIFWSLVAIGLWQTLSVFWAGDKTAVLWHSGEWWLWLAGYLYLINRLTSLAQLLWPLGIGLVIQSGIGILQYLNNGSLGLAKLGESVLNVSESGAPVVLSHGLHQLRAHGLTPHANILAGWLAVGFVWMAELGVVGKGRSKWVVVLVSLIAIGLFLAFSRAAWAVWLAVVVVGLVLAGRRREKGFRWEILAAVGVWLVMLAINWQAAFGRFDLTLPLESRSVGDRVGSVEIFEKVWSTHPFFGVGEGNYIQAVSRMDSPVRPAWTYQLVPNVYLLTLAELGVVGGLLWLVLLGAILLAVWARRKRLSWWLVSGFLIWVGLGLVDHWPMSLHQGWALLFVALALIILSDQLTYKDR